MSFCVSFFSLLLLGLSFDDLLYVVMIFTSFKLLTGYTVV